MMGWLTLFKRTPMPALLGRTGLNYICLANLSYFKKLRRINPTTQYLYSLGVDVEKLLLQKAPITYEKVENVQSYVSFLQNLGIDNDSLSIVLTKGHRFILAQIPELQQRIQFFSNLGLTNQDIVTMIITFPKLIAMQTTSNVLPRIEYLRSLALTDTEIASIILRNPTSLNYSPSKLKERLNIFQSTHLQINHQQLRKVVLDCPRLLSVKSSYSVRVILWLKSNYFNEDQVQQVFLNYPCIVTLDLANIDAIWKWMNDSRLVFVNKYQVKQKQSASLLQQLRAKLQTPYELREIIEYPMIFNQPLQKLQTRFEYLNSLKILDRKIIPFKDILDCDDESFAIEVADSNYQSYQQFIANYQSKPY